MLLKLNTKQNPAMKSIVQNAASVIFLTLIGLSVVSCDESPAPNRDYEGEHRLILEQMITSKTEMAAVLSDITDRAGADAATPKVKALSKKIHQLSNQDAALSREMSLERWNRCMEIDKEYRPRSLKAHEDVLRQVFYLKNASYYGSNLLLRALP